MKSKLILTALLLFGVTKFSLAQKDLPVFNTFLPVTWMGIDFTEARFTGDYYKFLDIEKTQKFIASLNALMVEEKDKYSVSKMLHRESDKIIYRLDIATDHNASLDVASLLADSTGSPMHLQEPDIDQIVSNYDFKQATGLGLLLIVEAFDKVKDEALIWVTVINIKSKEVLLTRRLITESGGFGLRNYWASSIHEAMNRTKQTQFNKWRDQAIQVRKNKSVVKH